MDDFNSLTSRGYQLKERIGAGGFGAVYRGFQTSVKREVAIKIILPQHANNPEFIRRFESEAQLIAHLEDKNIVPLYDFWRDPGGNAYLVMRFLPRSLQSTLKDGPWTTDATAALLDQLASALSAAHQQGIIHRDIKPDNILLDKNGNAFLADFGLAKVLEHSSSPTKSGEMVGSPQYVSPEQIRGATISPETDIYSLGLVLYELLTGTKAFQATSSPANLLHKHLNDPIPPLREKRPDLPESLNEVLQRATAKDPEQRYPDAQSLAAAFRAALEQDNERPVPPIVQGQPSETPVDNAVGTSMPPVEWENVGRWLQSLPVWRTLSGRVPMLRGTKVFILIMVLVIALICGAVIVQIPANCPTLHIDLAANAMAYDWVNYQASLFNAQKCQIPGKTVKISVTKTDSADIWQSGRVWSTSAHPTAWVAESKSSVDYVNATNLPYQVSISSLASTSLVWGVFADRAGKLDKPIDWSSIQKAAAKQSWENMGGSSAWGFVKPAFALPCNNTRGLSVLISAAASYKQTDHPTAGLLGDSTFQSWLQPVVDDVPNFAPLGQQPAEVLARSGSSVADFALLPESEWLIYYNQIAAHQPIQFVYPAYKIVFDMPLAIWHGDETSADQKQAVESFGRFLSQESAQQNAIVYGLRPAHLALTSNNAAPFLAAKNAGIMLDNPPGTPIIMPDRTGGLAILSWFKVVRPC